MYGGAPAAVATLGAPVAEYRGDVARPLLQAAGSLVGGLVAIAAAIGIFIAGFIGTLNIILIIFGALLIILAFALAAQALGSLGKSATTHQFGLTLKRRSQVDVIPWDDITQYLTYPFQPRTTGPSRRYTASTKPVTRYVIVRRNGQRIVLLGYQRLPELAATIERETGARFYPWLVNVYRSGQPIPFGPFIIGQQGIAQGPTLLPWNLVAGERILNGMLMIDRQGAPISMSAPLAQLPNLRAHLALIDAIRAGQV